MGQEFIFQLLKVYSFGQGLPGLNPCVKGYEAHTSDVDLLITTSVARRSWWIFF